MAFEEDLVRKYELEEIEHPPTSNETERILNFMEEFFEETSKILEVDIGEVKQMTLDELDEKVRNTWEDGETKNNPTTFLRTLL